MSNSSSNQSTTCIVPITTTTTTTKNKLNEKWLTLTTDEILELFDNKLQSSIHQNDIDSVLKTFLRLSTPILKQYKSGFIAEMEDIQFCLMVHVLDQDEIETQVCCINDQGELLARITERGLKATNLIKCYIFDYPEAIVTTAKRQPLCVFADKDDKLKKSNNKINMQKQAGSFGMFMGYMNLQTVKTILSIDKNKITVAIP